MIGEVPSGKAWYPGISTAFSGVRKLCDFFCRKGGLGWVYFFDIWRMAVIPIESTGGNIPWKETEALFSSQDIGGRMVHRKLS